MATGQCDNAVRRTGQRHEGAEADEGMKYRDPTYSPLDRRLTSILSSATPFPGSLTSAAFRARAKKESLFDFVQ